MSAWEVFTLFFAALTVFLLYKVSDLVRRVEELERTVQGAKMLERLHSVEKRVWPLQA